MQPYPKCTKCDNTAQYDNIYCGVCVEKQEIFLRMSKILDNCVDINDITDFLREFLVNK